MKKLRKWICVLCVMLLVVPLRVTATENKEKSLTEDTETKTTETENTETETTETENTETETTETETKTTEIETTDLESDLEPDLETKRVAVTKKENEVIIYEFLKKEFGFNTAVICGILANIYKESSFNEYAFNGNDTGGTQSYGLCQWNSGAGAGNRYKQLRDWCAANGYDYTTVEGQLNFVKHELKTISYYKLSYMQNYIENTADGAYETSKLWSKYYEGCNKRYHEERAILARDTYWTTYLEHPDTKVTISNNSKPNMLKLGESFTITGTIQSVEPLTKVSICIYDSSGKLVSMYNAEPNVTTYDLAELGTSLDFSKLKAGSYYYRIYAVDGTESVLLTNKGFVVETDRLTVDNGIYYMYTAQNSKYVIDIADSSNLAGANVLLDKKANTLYQMFEIKHVGNGFYTVMNLASGKYLEVANAGTESGTNVQMGDKKEDSSQKWQILSLGTGYCFVPECAQENCLDLENGSVSANLNVRIWQTNLGETQKFGLTPINWNDLTKGKLSVEKISGEQRTTIEIPITLTENLGITKLQVSLSYDDANLKFVELKNGNLFEISLLESEEASSKSVSFVWEGKLTENLSETGTLGWAVFEVLATADVGDTTIEVKVDSASDYKENTISVDDVFGIVEIIRATRGIPGDVNGDGEVKLNDALLLRRYVAGYEIELDVSASDVNGDGEVKLNDALLLRRYVAGYEVPLQ